MFAIAGGIILAIIGFNALTLLIGGGMAAKTFYDIDQEIKKEKGLK